MKESTITRSSPHRSKTAIEKTIGNIKDNLQKMHEDHKATTRKAYEIDKSTRRHFFKYDKDNISDEKKLINELRDVCSKINNEDEWKTRRYNHE